MRACANCGTEVDDEAAFCPSCGQPLAEPPRTPAAPPPPAPAWHADDEAASGGPATEAWASRRAVDESRPGAAGSLVPPIEPRDEVPAAPETPVAREAPTTRGAPAVREGPVTREAPVPPPEPYDEPVTARDERPASPPSRQAPPVQPPGTLEDRPAAERAPAELPISLPVTLSGWLVGGGALVGALALFADFRLFSNPITFVLLVLLFGVAATVFLAPRMPAIPYLQLGVMVTIFTGLGVALDRVGFGSIVGIGSAILLLAMIAAATGVIIAETGRDRPWAGPGQG